MLPLNSGSKAKSSQLWLSFSNCMKCDIAGCDSIISLLLSVANELATMVVRDPELLSTDE